MPLSESESKVLLALLNGGNQPIMSLPRVAGLGGGAVYNSVRWLSEKELVIDQREKDPPRRRMIVLTGRGKKIATLLHQLEHELNQKPKR